MTYQMTNKVIIKKIKQATIWTITMILLGMFLLMVFAFTFATLLIICAFISFIIAILFEISREALIIRMEIRCQNE